MCGKLLKLGKPISKFHLAHSNPSSKLALSVTQVRSAQLLPQPRRPFLTLFLQCLCLFFSPLFGSVPFHWLTFTLAGCREEGQLLAPSAVRPAKATLATRSACHHRLLGGRRTPEASPLFSSLFLSLTQKGN